jgi:hypothetical protein
MKVSKNRLTWRALSIWPSQEVMSDRARKLINSVDKEFKV